MRNIPIVTKNLLIVNVVAFLACMLMDKSMGGGSGLTDMFGLHFFLASDFHIYQLVTYMFMHGGFQHILFNMFALWMFGCVVERVWGPKKFLFYYIVCGVGAGLFQEAAQYITYVAKDMAAYDYVSVNGARITMEQYLNLWTTVGASGAIYAILLAFGMIYPNERLFIFPLPVPIKAKFFVIGYAVIELVSTFSLSDDGVAHIAHLGGMVFGFFLIRYWRKQIGNGYYQSNSADAFDKLKGMFGGKRRAGRTHFTYTKNESYNPTYEQDAECKTNEKVVSQEEIDRILDTCGHVIECPNCAIPMIWHAKDQMLKCHYCNHAEYFPDVCPECGSDAFKNSGTGTQKIEQYIKELFPENNVERIDSDILVRKGEHIRLLEKFQRGDIDILVGTQMIAKGLDNPNVTLVGVISADASFNLPDFRASERGFQLLTQVAGRAGRGEFAGKVLFQTYNPDFYALESAKSQNYAEFYTAEIAAREEFDYPPFSQIIRLILSSQNGFRAEKSAQEIAMRLSLMVEKFGISERIEVLGPTPCVIERINSQYRFQILIKNKMGEKGHQFVSSFMNKIIMPKDIRLAIDVDPLDIL